MKPSNNMQQLYIKRMGEVVQILDDIRFGLVHYEFPQTIYHSIQAAIANIEFATSLMHEECKES